MVKLDKAKVGDVVRFVISKHSEALASRRYHLGICLIFAVDVELRLIQLVCPYFGGSPMWASPAHWETVWTDQ